MRVKITFKVVLNALGVLDLTQTDNITASKVVTLLVKFDQPPALSLFQILNMYFVAF